MKKFSYPKKDVTVTASVNVEGAFGYSAKQKVLHRATELCEIAPFDWENQKLHGDRVFLMYFGFDSLEKAEAAKGRLEAANFQVWLWDLDIENKILGTALRQSEAQGFEASLDDGFGNQIDWKNDPRFAEKKEH
jgi:hypothetical protein